MRLRYSGKIPVSFMGLPYVGEVFPDEEFDVPDDVGEKLLARSDIAAILVEQPPAEPEPSAAAKPRKPSASKGPDPSEPAVTDSSKTA